MFTLECCCWRILLRILWTAEKTNKCIIKQSNPLCKESFNAGKGGKKGEGRPMARWMDSVTKAMSAQLEDLKGQVRDRLSWRKWM